MSENYPWIIWELFSENYEWELSSENYHLVYHHAKKLRFIGILAYPKMYSSHLDTMLKFNHIDFGPFLIDFITILFATIIFLIIIPFV